MATMVGHVVADVILQMKKEWKCTEFLKHKHKNKTNGDSNKINNNDEVW